MVNRKELILVVVFLFVFLTPQINAALGISPAKFELNFEPNLEKSFEFHVQTDDQSQKLEIYSKGEFSKYISFDKKELTGSGSFTATIKLPNEPLSPGKNRFIVGVKEEIDKELSNAIGTSVAVQAPIDVMVPYPGKYLLMTLSSHNANEGDPIRFDLKIENLGREDLTIVPRIEIYSEGSKKGTLFLNERLLKSQENVELKKLFNTSGYEPGRYNARAIINYDNSGNFAEAKSDFRIGTLLLEIINYTNEIELGGLKKFEINVENDWNDPISGAHAEVSFLQNGSIFYSFKTSPSDLNPWEIKTINGFFDTSNFSAKTYDANITLRYYGFESGKSTSRIVKVNFIKAKMNISYVMIGVGAITLIAIILFIVFITIYLMKNGKRK